MQGTSVTGRNASLVAVAAACLPACSLFGPPLPPALPSQQTLEHEAQPIRAREAFIRCAHDYGRSHGAARDVPIEAIIDAAIYACNAQLEAYRAIAEDRAKTSPRILGWIDRSDAYAQEAVEGATEEARKAALDAVIRTRTP